MVSFDEDLLRAALGVMEGRVSCAFGLVCAQRCLVPDWLQSGQPEAVKLEEIVVECWERIDRNELILSVGEASVRAGEIARFCDGIESGLVYSVCDVFRELVLGMGDGTWNSISIAEKLYSLADGFAQDDIANILGEQLFVVGAPVQGLVDVSEQQILGTERVQRELTRQRDDLATLSRFGASSFQKLSQRRSTDREEFYRNVEPDLLVWS